MSKDETLRRGKPENRSHFDRAKDAYENAKGETRITERIDRDEVNGGCPECHAPMTLRNYYRGEQSYRFEGICSADPDHNLERYGYYSTEGA
jgi:hypothetical protein